jgi:hypothetical protein
MRCIKATSCGAALLAITVAAGCSSAPPSQAEKDANPAPYVATTQSEVKVAACEFKGNVRAILLPPNDRDRILPPLSPDTETRAQVKKMGGNTLLIAGRIFSVMQRPPDQDKNFDMAAAKVYACPAGVFASIR